MLEAELDAYDRTVLKRLHVLLGRRYGRDGDISRRGHKVSLLEAGYATVGAWWPLEDSLARSGTSFLVEDLHVRMDLMLRDVLLHPEEPLDRAWAERYGYRSPSAATRAFRDRYGVSLGDARRMGTLGEWLAQTRRHPRSFAGVSRRSEAAARIKQFRRRVRRGTLGPGATLAYRSLGDRSVSPSGKRPRYPAVAACERSGEAP